MQEKIPVADRVKKSFSDLSSVASVLNASSDKLSNNIAALEAELKKLSLGVSSFVIFDDRIPERSLFYDFDKLHYSKVNGKWGLAIETMVGHEEADSPKVHEIWPFNEAPRGKRVKAVKFIPELLDRLAKDAAAMVADVNEQSKAVAEITEAIRPAPEPATPESPFPNLESPFPNQPIEVIGIDPNFIAARTVLPPPNVRDLSPVTPSWQPVVRPVGGKRK